ncbi:MAG: DUF3179 domain-containing (seleno)protein [Limisphaerales bacterium]
MQITRGAFRPLGIGAGIGLGVIGALALVCGLRPADGERTMSDTGQAGIERAFESPTEPARVVVDGVALFPGRRRDEPEPIDHPVFESAPRPSAALADDDWVVGIRHGDTVRAYPLWVLARSEIVNDRFGHDPICVTYCPLSGSVVAFLARIGSRDLAFGNAGALYECNLVMFDRGTGSLWYQLRGRAIHGPLAGEALEVIPAQLVRWATWRERNPGGGVLVADGRAGRFFRVSEGGQEARATHEEPDAPVSRTDARWPTRTRMVGFQRTDGSAVCLPRDWVEALPAGRHRVPEGAGLWLETEGDGYFRAFGADGIEMAWIPADWFAWYAAFPSGFVFPNPGK